LLQDAKTDGTKAWPRLLTTENLQRQADIPVRESSDKTGCNLMGMALVPDKKMVLCDCNNKSVKLLDLESGHLVSSLRLSSPPWDVCAIPGQQVAVTLPDEGKIQVVSTQRQLTLTTRIKTRQGCRGIRYWQDTLIVTFSEGTVLVIDLKGNVVMEMDNTNAGYLLFKCPLYVTVDYKGSTLYVSDGVKNTITKMDLTLKVVATIKNKTIRAPHGMFPLDDHHLLVCSFGSHNVVLLNTETQEERVVLGPGQGILWPRCVSYSAELGKLYVTCYRCDSVKVFAMRIALEWASC